MPLNCAGCRADVYKLLENTYRGRQGAWWGKPGAEKRVSKSSASNYSTKNHVPGNLHHTGFIWRPLKWSSAGPLGT
eukprot:808093-Pelagomonas_calceolata.AAC.3